ncbi:MAG: UDP-N-acetylmuramyl-tripeptide synthetase [Clostridia bacterium]|nr:UDP-N-acetylmuramyl-tripeptide synthetase [Clostridia bacterium]
MKLKEVSHLFGAPSPVGRDADIEITKVVTSSELADENTLFYARDGMRHLAKDTACDAVRHGCRAVLTDSRNVTLENASCFLSNRAGKMALMLEKHLYFEVLHDLEFVFVTGTKGKTTVANMLAHILNSIDIPTAVSGTLGFCFSGNTYLLKNTTPDIFTLLPYIEEAKNQGARVIVLEVSSQALLNHRVDGIRGKYGIFTGISPDHIDEMEHENFASYRDAKRRLFSDFGITTAFSPRTISLSPFMVSGVKETLFVDTKAPSNLTLKPVKMSKSDMLYTDGSREDTLSLCGEYNLQNAALALLCASRIASVPPFLLYPALRTFTIEGRGERFSCQGREIIIDYAHNAESIEALVSGVRPFLQGRTIAVSGSVGDKARGRRIPLARTLERFFDITILTEDDTRDERREDIIEQLYCAFTDKCKAIVEPDRRRAIVLALSLAKEGDTVFLLGKGHERYLIRAGIEIPFSEKEIVQDYYSQDVLHRTE